MANVTLQLSYDKLSDLLQEETNKQNIEIRGHKITIEKLVITSDGERLRATAKLKSTWDAYFDFSALPSFNTDQNKLVLEDITLGLDAKNLIFKGILKLAKGNIKGRIEKIIEAPLNEQLNIVKQKLDEELAKTPLPFELKIGSKTKNIEINQIQAREEHLFVSARIDQDFSIGFK